MAPEQRVRRTAFASTLGTVLEYYDFFIYGTAAALLFNKLFFPTVDPLVGTLAAFATYAVAFLARPLGGLVFGHFGDRLGRKRMLVITIVMTGLGTFLVGLMPTYDTIGIWAPILLVTIRLVQGFGVGGEQGGAVLLTCETAPAERRGFYGSLVQLGAPAGFLLPAGLFALLTSTMSEATFTAWGWRIPFLLSAVVIGVGLWVRLKVSESPAFEEARHRQSEQSPPLRDLLTSQRRRTLLGVGAKFIESSLFPLATTFVVAYAASQDVEESVVLNAVLVAVAVELLAIPLWGRLTDRVGRRPVFLFGAAVHLVMIVPLFLAVRSGSGLWIGLALLVALPIAHAATYAPQASFFPELFPTRVRYSGMSVVWQFGALVASGPFTVVAAALLAAMGGAFWGVALYVAVLALVSVACLLVLPETAPARRGGRDLEDWGLEPEPAAQRTGRFVRKETPATVRS